MHIFKYIIFNNETAEPVEVAKDLTEASEYLKKLGLNTHTAKPFRRYKELLENNDPDKFNILNKIIKYK